MKDTISKGDVTVLAVALALAKRGEHVLFPFSEGERYDIALDRSGVLYRIQCKTGWLKRGVVMFRVCSNGPRSALRTYHGHIEAFGIYCRELDAVYLVPFDAVANVKSARATLRIDSPKNSQGHRYRFASDYVV